MLKQKEEDSKREEEESGGDGNYKDSHLTNSQKRFLKAQNDKLEKQMERVLEMSHRDRVNKFNENLASLTEHNDIPRVSAAGNG